MNARKSCIVITLFMIVGLFASACASAATPTPAPAAPLKTAPASSTDASTGDTLPINFQNAVPHEQGRMIIKNGELSLLVADSNRAIDLATGIAVNSGGYVISSKTSGDVEFKSATLTLGVPSDQFEAAQRQLRALAVQVLSDTSSGQDVSEEYVDLQSRLTNLEATAARIREFLQQATRVDEALVVNAKLTEVDGQIEQVKGRMQYLQNRSAFSTIAVNLEPQRPASTPPGWTPSKTIDAAANALAGLLRGLADTTIWLAIAIAPVGVPVVLVLWLIARTRRSRVKPGSQTAITPSGK